MILTTTNATAQNVQINGVSVLPDTSQIQMERQIATGTYFVARPVDPQDRQMLDEHTRYNPEQASRVATIAAQMQSYVSPVGNADFTTHLERHIGLEGTIGSKFPDYLDQDAAAYARQIDILTRNAFINGHGPDGKQPGRLEIAATLEDSLAGHDPLISIKDRKNTFQLVRDAGTPNEATINVVRVNSYRDIPETRDVNIIAGPYGPTGKWGVYTAFVGQMAPAMPNERQPEAVRQSNAEFWNTHGFLATNSQIEFVIGQMVEEMKLHPEKTAVYQAMIERARASGSGPGLTATQRPASGAKPQVLRM